MRFIKNLFLVAALAVTTQFGFAQSTLCNYPGTTLTDAIYWAHQPPAVQALQNYTGTDITPKALALAVQGYTIDVYIQVWHMDPVCTMGLRHDYGYTWVPSALQPNIAIAPNLSVPGQVAYDAAHPPTGSILVSLNAADYPPFNPPVVVPVTPPSNNLVGVCYVGSAICPVGPGAGTPAQRNAAGLRDGVTVSQSGVQYVYHESLTPFGSSVYFTTTALSAPFKAGERVLPVTIPVIKKK